ncbi:tryptophan halogenase family protein [Phenylobacterium montanum]|uniref:Tryptophan 7-halogenase n=1 Tax=Phenylobacterium montanum TaxID=2823693 RepID=A0A975G2J3_9CAUL|nr:tryptophan halogenase family protein [Caulobacter sp. S6]QUD89409.1 tryptophan 7-halogenase [Caulobacter sp. S6]
MNTDSVEATASNVSPLAIRKVVIVGGGTAGWMSAALLSKTFGAKLDITLIESDEISTVGVGEATIPHIQSFNRLVGVDENDFIKATQGTFKLAIDFRDWTGPGSRYFHAFGPIGQHVGWLYPHQYWLKARRLGRAGSMDAFCIGAQAALRNKFMPADPKAGNSPLAEISHAYHFDAGLYAAYLRKRAESQGVTRIEGKIVGHAKRAEDGFIESVTLERGETVAGELFIDCSGFRGLLIEQALGAGFEDWSHWLPCNRALAVPCASVTPLTPYTRVTKREAGWQWRIPLQHRIGNGYVYSSDHISDDEAASNLLGRLDGEALGDPRPLRFTPGKRNKAWVKNVVAVGLASGFLEPLESTSIHMIQTALFRLLSLFPDKRFACADIDAYNDQTDVEYRWIRDFIIAHYKLVDEPTPLWRYCRNMAVPESLQEKLDVFASAGRIFANTHDLFREVSWIQVLIGQGLIPERYDPAVDLTSPEDILAHLDGVEQVVSKCVNSMPYHSDYIARTCRAGPISA